MTGAQQISEFKIGFDVISSNAAPGFTDSEIYSLLNRGQDYIILDLYKQKNWDLLGTLIYEDGNTPISQGLSVYTISNFNNYWLYVSSYSIVHRLPLPSTGFMTSLGVTDVSYRKFTNDFISVEEKEKYLTSPFNLNRIFKNPKFFIANNEYNVILDDYTNAISFIMVRYIRKRLDISSSQSCELQESLHRLVVDKAIDIAKTIINIQEPQSTSK
jgi:hypothetical protein